MVATMTTYKHPPLWERMRTYAAKLKAEPGCDDEGTRLIDMADKLEVAATGFYSTPQTHTVAQMMKAYARAKLLWCDITGEPLV